MRSFQSMGCGIVLKLIAGCEILTPERPFQNQGGIGIKILKVLAGWRDEVKTGGGILDLKILFWTLLFASM